MNAAPSWLSVSRGDAPLILSMPHTGTDLAGLDARFVSPWLARKDADWWVDKLYAFGKELGATIVCTTISRSVIDVNRDPSGASLYPGQTTTELCPTTTFDGEALYAAGGAPTEAEIAERRDGYFAPYHAALESETARLKAKHPRIVLYDCHSIRSSIPRLFEGELPNFNIGTNSGKACAPELASAIAAVCASTAFSHVVNGRFKGGFITRSRGRPETGVHALQMELSCRGYMREASGPVGEQSWPVAFDETFAAPMRAALRRILETCLSFAAKAPTPV